MVDIRQLARELAATARVTGADPGELVANYAGGDGLLIEFYEEFIRAYDPDGARGRGVHYTPPEVVSYIVRGVEWLLRERLGYPLEDAVLLDPCCGVGAFFRYVTRRFEARPRMIGLELLPTACQIASRLLEGCEIVNADGLGDFDIQTGGKPLVLLGNPPYSGHSANAGKPAHLMADYRAGLSERNPKWLQDDYVKFIRMAQSRVEEAGRGIVAFITNHSYVFNPTFRVMRSSLMRAFDEIHILDLHGNARLGRGSRGENIFPIRMGVAISFMVKTSDASECRPRYASLDGTREEKLHALNEMDFASTPWREVPATGPFFVFSPRDQAREEEYYGFPSITDLFRESSVGFVTSCDSFAIDFDREALLERVEGPRGSDLPPNPLPKREGEQPAHSTKQEGETCSPPRLGEGLGERFLPSPSRGGVGGEVIEVLYRPFDRRWAYYSPAIMERPRLPFMRNLMLPLPSAGEGRGEGNIALAIGRAGQATGSEEWDVVFCADCPADLNLFRRGGAMLFPRWVYPDGERLSNMTIDDPNPDLVFYYMYALLHSTTYRDRYREQLMIDFPRIPIPRDTLLLESLAEAGAELIAVHLMRDTSHPSGSLTLPESAKLTIGGYDIPGKYIKDRKGRELTIREGQHLRRIRTAVEETIAIRKRIDDLVRADPPWK